MPRHLPEACELPLGVPRRVAVADGLRGFEPPSDDLDPLLDAAGGRERRLGRLDQAEQLRPAPGLGGDPGQPKDGIEIVEGQAPVIGDLG
jgi:hypothetical protein